MNQTANDVPLLVKMVEQGKVALTPPQDYDDSYCIDYAIKHNGCIVTNDRYWDHIDKQVRIREPILILILMNDSDCKDTERFALYLYLYLYYSYSYSYYYYY